MTSKAKHQAEAKIVRAARSWARSKSQLYGEDLLRSPWPSWASTDSGDEELFRAITGKAVSP
jgi:hypothetical protein